MVEAALARNKGNLTRAAAELEISRPSLYELIDKLRHRVSSNPTLQVGSPERALADASILSISS